MALADFAALRAKIATPDQLVRQVKVLAAGVGKSNRFTVAFEKGYDDTGAIPSTAAACDLTTAGAMFKSNAGSGRQCLVGGVMRFPGASSSTRVFLLIDRLSHQGGLVGNITTSQTTNLPTAALTRYTSGVGVLAAINIYTALGATATQLDMTYTNSAGAGSRVGSLVQSSSEYNAVGRWEIIPLAAGDLGVKSVESVQLSASTGAAGNWGITLFKPIGFVIVNSDGAYDILNNAMWSEEILDDACLQAVYFNSPSGAAAASAFTLAEC